MTLSQRLTRAGLTFVLFGTVAAVLPQQNGAAQAETTVCPTNSQIVYSLTGNTANPGSITASISKANPTPLYTLESTNGGTTYSALSGVTVTSGTPANITINDGMSGVSVGGQVVARGAGTVGSSSLVTATFGSGNNTVMASLTATVTQ